MGQLPNLDGRWTSPRENYSVNIVMVRDAGDGAFNMKAISPEILKYWQGGYGEVFESRKLHATFTGKDKNGNPLPEVQLQGYVSADLQTIKWSNDRVWNRH